MPLEQTFSGPTRTAPRWLADPVGPLTSMPPGGRLDASQFLALDGVRITATAAAAQGATSITVAALAKAVPAGVMVDFGAAKLAITSAAAAAGATALPVRALPTALVGNEVGTYLGKGKKYVEGGTFVSRTFTQRDALSPFHPGISTEDETYLTLYDVDDLDRNDFVELVAPGTKIKENYLPGWSTLPTDVKTKIRQRYVCILGSTGV